MKTYALSYTRYTIPSQRETEGVSVNCNKTSGAE